MALPNDTIFNFYEGNDVSQYDWGTGENLNRAPNQLLANDAYLEDRINGLGLPAIPSGSKGKVLRVNATNDGYVLEAPTSAPTASRLMVRDANGRTQVENPSAGADVANKNFSDEPNTVYIGTQSDPNTTQPTAMPNHRAPKVGDIFVQYTP